MGGQTNNPTNCSKCTLLEQPNLSLVWDSSVSTRKDIQQVSVSALMHTFTQIKWKKNQKCSCPGPSDIRRSFLTEAEHTQQRYKGIYSMAVL